MTPPSKVLKRVSVQVSANNVDFSKSYSQFDYTEKMSILHVTPEFGTVDNALEIEDCSRDAFENYTSLFCHLGAWS